jgi:hypothetical protein
MRWERSRWRHLCGDETCTEKHALKSLWELLSIAGDFVGVTKSLSSLRRRSSSR